MTESAWKYPAKYLTLNGETPEAALKDVTDLVVLAHPDDAEIVAPDLILACQKDPSRKLGVIIITDGRGAPRHGEFAAYTDQQLAVTRTIEQAAAAEEGKYHFLGMLQHPDTAATPIDQDVATKEVSRIMQACPKLKNIVTHNPFDFHAGHLGVFAATVSAARLLPEERQKQIETFRGGEVWGEISHLNTVPDGQVNKHLQIIPLSQEMLDVQHRTLAKHRSQTEGAKPYLGAVAGRQAARGTFENPYIGNDQDNAMLAVDLKPFIQSKHLSATQFTTDANLDFTRRTAARVQNLDVFPSTRVEPGATAMQAFDQLQRITR